jgi:3-isopropylmalate/(R)-2-methylmalate dehydratase small subunit
MDDVKRVVIRGRAVPVRGDEIDTDRIVPARFLKEITFEKMGEYLFYDSRRSPTGEKLDHPLNDPRYEGAAVLIVGKNFGCGSSREHAPQAIVRHGIRAIVGESFAEIFAGNCKALGVPTVTVSPEDAARLFDAAETHPDTEFVVDLSQKTIRFDSTTLPLEIPEGRRKALMEGIWSSTNMLRANAPRVRETADRLPYIHNYRS